MMCRYLIIILCGIVLMDVQGQNFYVGQQLGPNNSNVDKEVLDCGDLDGTFLHTRVAGGTAPGRPGSMMRSIVSSLKDNLGIELDVNLPAGKKIPLNDNLPSFDLKFIQVGDLNTTNTMSYSAINVNDNRTYDPVPGFPSTIEIYYSVVLSTGPNAGVAEAALDVFSYEPVYPSVQEITHQEPIFSYSTKDITQLIKSGGRFTPDQQHVYIPWKKVSLPHKYEDDPAKLYDFYVTGPDDPDTYAIIYFALFCLEEENPPPPIIKSFCPGSGSLEIDYSDCSEEPYLYAGDNIKIINKSVNTATETITLDYLFFSNLAGDKSFIDAGCAGYYEFSAPASCFDEPNFCGHMQLRETQSYVLSYWGKNDITANPNIVGKGEVVLSFEGGQSFDNIVVPMDPAHNGEWHRVEYVFEVPDGASVGGLEFLNEGAAPAYFDDVRIVPVNANAESYIYNPDTRQLEARLDPNNYATMYEYDAEGNLVRIKKETERGVKTITEGRKERSKLAP